MLRMFHHTRQDATVTIREFFENNSRPDYFDGLRLGGESGTYKGAKSFSPQEMMFLRSVATHLPDFYRSLALVDIALNRARVEKTSQEDYFGFESTVDRCYGVARRVLTLENVPFHISLEAHFPQKELVLYHNASPEFHGLLKRGVSEAYVTNLGTTLKELKS